MHQQGWGTPKAWTGGGGGGQYYYGPGPGYQVQIHVVTVAMNIDKKSFTSVLTFWSLRYLNSLGLGPTSRW